jgi:NADH-quinone oxidoreductase subunit J
MSFDQIVFVISAAVALFGGTMMIAQRNPVASVLYLILSLVAQAVLYVQLSAMFIGALLIIVYAGAILVLFLFVIMLLNLRGSDDLGAPLPPVSLFSKIAIPLLLFVEIFIVIGREIAPGGQNALQTPLTAMFGSVQVVARMMFTDYLYPFQLTGILLLVAIVGAVVIARRETPTRGTGTPAPTGEESLTEEVSG